MADPVSDSELRRIVELTTDTSLDEIINSSTRLPNDVSEWETLHWRHFLSAAPQDALLGTIVYKLKHDEKYPDTWFYESMWIFYDSVFQTGGRDPMGDTRDTYYEMTERILAAVVASLEDELVDSDESL